MDQQRVPWFTDQVKDLKQHLDAVKKYGGNTGQNL